MKVLALTLISSLALGGCGLEQSVRDNMTEGRYQDVAGRFLELKQPLPVEVDRARVFIQDGEVRGAGAINQYRTQCNLELDQVALQAEEIEPDTFRIVRVQRAIEQVVLTRPVQVASLQLAGRFDGGSSAFFEGYHFWLSSGRQGDVRRLSCYGTYAEPADLRPPTLQEIRQTLGDIAEIRR